MRPAVGGKPRKENRREDDPGGGAALCGRATRKTAVIGALQRRGKVVAGVARDLSGKGILRFFRTDNSSALNYQSRYRMRHKVENLFAQLKDWRPWPPATPLCPHVPLCRPPGGHSHLLVLRPEPRPQARARPFPPGLLIRNWGRVALCCALLRP